MDNNKILELIRENREFTPRIMQDCASYKFFLKLCANNYRYSFSDQSIIFMQKPNASNCASYEFWKENGRRVKKGAKGIALLRKGIFLSYIIYVFDRADTEGIRPNEIPLKQPSKAKIKNLITNMHFQYKHVLPELSEKISRLCFNEAEAECDKFYAEFCEVKSDVFIEKSDFIRHAYLSSAYELKLILNNNRVENPDEKVFSFVNRYTNFDEIYVLGNFVNTIVNNILLKVGFEDSPHIAEL